MDKKQKKELNRDIPDYFFKNKSNCGGTGYSCRYSKMLDDFDKDWSVPDKKVGSRPKKSETLEELEEYKQKKDLSRGRKNI